MASFTPIYAPLVSFTTADNGYFFPPKTSSVSNISRNPARPMGYLLNSMTPIDLAGGGKVPFRSTDWTWIYHIVAPQDTPMELCPAYVEGEYNALDTFLTGTNGNGTSMQLGRLTVKFMSGGTVSVRAALVDTSIRESQRTYSYLPLNLVFTLIGEFQ